MEIVVSGDDELAPGKLVSLGDEIRNKILRSVGDMIWIGRVLGESERLILEMKRMGKKPMPYSRWLKDVVGITPGIASNYRQLFHKYESEERIALLPPAVALELCSPNVPKEAVDRVIHECETGRIVTRKEVRGLVEEFTGKARQRSERVKGIDSLLSELSRLFDRHRGTVDHAVAIEDVDGLRKIRQVLTQYANSITARV